MRGWGEEFTSGDVSQKLIKRAARDLAGSHYAIALTGAGISTESGIPDFRGPSGVWTKDPEAERRAYETYPRFVEDPKGWWEELLASPRSPMERWKNAKPNVGHYALAELEHMGILKWTITQNIDGLHERAGTKNLLEYHGSALKLRCTSCNLRFPADECDLEKLREEERLPPRCPDCGGITKPDVVYFGEPIPYDVAHRSIEEAEKCDVMLVCGTSAVVYPFASLPRIAAGIDAAYLGSAEKGSTVKIIEVNAEPTPLTYEQISSYLIQGNTGEVLPRIADAVKRLRS
jgi:NAD-dependent deacetylase